MNLHTENLKKLFDLEEGIHSIGLQSFSGNTPELCTLSRHH
jgi:hypothetical protein